MPDSLDPALVDAFQMAGQDIPWLVSHWSKQKPDHPFLIWEPKSGDERRWSYAEFDAATARIGAGLAASRREPGASSPGGAP